MGVQIPPRPVQPTDPGALDPSKPEDAQKLREYDMAVTAYQDQLARYNRMLQQTLQQQAEEAAARSNMDKTRHDAMMGIINNMKA